MNEKLVKGAMLVLPLFGFTWTVYFISDLYETGTDRNTMVFLITLIGSITSLIVYIRDAMDRESIKDKGVWIMLFIVTGILGQYAYFFRYKQG
ncbi:MAG: hypothetical protein JXQ90_11810 [Cyclobacteriaceae bacterium]